MKTRLRTGRSGARETYVPAGLGGSLALPKALVFLMVMVLGGPAAQAQTDSSGAARLLKEGNELLAAKKYADALEKYDKARGLLPESPEVAYNRGLAYYRLNRFEQAEKAFQDAIRPGRPELEAKTKFNLGRSAHAQGLARAQTEKDKEQDAINDLDRAVQFYNEALQLAPTDRDAKLNRELAERMRLYLQQRLEEKKKEQQKQPSSQPTSQPQQNQPSSQPQEGQPQPSSQSSESQASSQPSEQQQQNASSQPTSRPDSQQPQSQPSSQPDSGKDKEQNADKSQDQKDQDKKDKEDAGEAEQKDKKDATTQPHEKGEKGSGDDKAHKIRKLSPEEAERFLQQARDQENRRRAERRARLLRSRGRIPVDKDW